MIAAEGEQKASHALKEAASVIQESPSALQVIIFIFPPNHLYGFQLWYSVIVSYPNWIIKSFLLGYC